VSRRAAIPQHRVWAARRTAERSEWLRCGRWRAGASVRTRGALGVPCVLAGQVPGAGRRRVPALGHAYLPD